MSKNLANPCLAVGVVLVLSACVGCGTREYEKRLAAGVKQIGQQSAFIEMRAASALPGTPVMVRVPQLFKDPLLVDGAPVGGRPVDPRRVKPPVVDLPGLKLTYEAFIVDGAGGKMPYYCYLAVVDVSTLRNPDPNRFLRLRLAKAFPDTMGNWEPVQCKTPQGRAYQWQRIRSTGKQEFFYVDQDGQESFRQMDGLMEFYYRREGNFLVIIGWRMPESIEQNVALQNWAPRVAGSVTLKQDG